MERTRQLKSSIVALQELIAYKQIYKSTRWELFQDYFTKQRPLMADEIRSLHPYDEKVVADMSEKELEHVSTEIVHELKKKVIP